MELEIDDWRFWVNIDATRKHTVQNASDHCRCSYCKNYYETALLSFPELGPFFNLFGIDFYGPSEIMPFEHDYVLVCYRVYGSILQSGSNPLQINGITVLPEISDSESFFLWIGEMELPWIQDESPQDVVSPANLPEFLERMQEIWKLRHESESILC